MPPSALTASRFRYLGKVIPGTVPAGSGQLLYSVAFTFRKVGSTLKAYIMSSSMILEFDIPASRSGTMTYVRNLGGELPREAETAFRGIFWDETDSRLYCSSSDDYDTTSATAKTLGRSYIDPTTNLLVKDGLWAFSSRSDKQTSGGVCAVPSWFATAYTGGKRLAAGFGGYYSIVETGPASMGPALTAFDPPATSYTGTLANTPLVGYNFGNYPSNRQQRPTNYINEFGDHFPNDPTIGGVGYWTWDDTIGGAGCWINTTNYSGFVTVPTLGTQCCWYGNNFGVPSPCSGTTGTPAAVNSTFKRHYLIIHDPADLAEVAQGHVAQNTIQGAITAFPQPGLPLDLPGMPSPRYRASSVAWHEGANVFGIWVREGSGANKAPALFLYEIDDTTSSPSLSAPTLYAPANGAVNVTNATTSGSYVRWNAVSGADSYDVYHGTAVSPPLLGTVTAVGGASATFPGTLQFPVTRADGTTYYWKITAKNANTSTTGPVWSYTTFLPPPPPPPLVVTTGSLPSGQVGSVYSATLTGSGGVPPYTWSASVPAGLSCSSSGVITGTPTVAGTFTVTATLTDSQPVSSMASLTLVIAALPPPPPPPPPPANDDFVSAVALSGSASTAPVTGTTVDATEESGEPAGLSTVWYRWTGQGLTVNFTLNDSSHVLQVYTGSAVNALSAVTTSVGGIASWSAVNGTVYRLRVRPVAAEGGFSFSWSSVAPPPPPPPPPPPNPPQITTVSLVSGTVGSPYATTLSATAGTTPYSWGFTGLPSGLSGASSGVISGTPTVAGTFSVVATVTDAVALTDAVTLGLVVVALPPPPDPDPVPDPTQDTPDAPVLFQPPNQEVGTTDRRTKGNVVRWYAAARAEDYDVYYGTVNPPPFLGTVDSSQNISDQYPGTYYLAVSRKRRTTYFWRVVAKNGAGSASSETWTFRMK